MNTEEHFVGYLYNVDLIKARNMERVQRNRINLKICEGVYPYVFVV